VSERFGAIKAALEKRGKRIEDFDAAIAAHALVEGAVLVTANLGQLTRVSGLKVEDWSKMDDRKNKGPLTRISHRFRDENGEPAADYANYADADLTFNRHRASLHPRNSRNPRLVPHCPLAMRRVYR